MNVVDLIVIGAGSSGSIIASKLSEQSNLNILVLEAGPKDLNPIIKIPLGYGMTFYNKRINWNFYSSPQSNLYNRELYCPRGKVVGGSGAINAMVYTRGFKTDYQDWSNAIDKEWSIKNIEHSYNKIENKIILKDNQSSKNKIFVNDVSSSHHKILENFFNGVKELNLSVTKNFSDFQNEGFGNYNITTRNGYRWTAADGFLKPSLKKKNIKLLTNANVQKLILKNHRITGVEYIQHTILHKVEAKIGVIMTAGSIKTPQILMHSGIGSAESLKKNGIKVELENHNVGLHLQDHIGLNYIYKSRIPTLNQSLGTFSGRIKSFIQYFLFRNGPLSLSINQGGGFLKWKNKEEYPNLQIYFNPLTYSISYKNKRPLLQTDKFNGFVIGFNSCRPKSRGTVSIKSNDINDDPVINPNYLSNHEDIYDLECAFDFVRQLTKTKAIKEVMINPLTIDPLKVSNEELIKNFKKKSSSVYHPCGTCRMGSNKKNSVVSHRLKVHDFENLWVADASIFPNITSGNINAPVMMMAFKGSELILEDIKRNK